MKRSIYLSAIKLLPEPYVDDNTEIIEFSDLTHEHLIICNSNLPLIIYLPYENKWEVVDKDDVVCGANIIKSVNNLKKESGVKIK